jgi:hypothetical protein
MKKFFTTLSSILFIFLILNFILSLILTPINNFVVTNILNKPIYNDDALKAINIVRSEERVFYNENWNRNFKYVQFAEHYEAETHKQKYVNVSKFNGREVKNNSNCDINFYFYGSSLTFGYNVKDTQTIPSYFKKTLESLYPMSNYCVFNFGSASYFSTQENILFQTHILNNKIKASDFIFFIDGYSEEGNQKSRVSRHLEKIFNGVNARMLGELKFSFSFFWDSLPTTKIFIVIKNLFYKDKTKIENIKNINNPENMIKGVLKKEIKEVFQKNILMRRAICNDLKLNCYTFLQPFPNIHGTHNKKLSNDPQYEHPDLEKYNLLKDIKYIFDISNALDKDIENPFGSSNHYSPESSKLIAKSIYTIVKNKIDEYKK